MPPGNGGLGMDMVVVDDTMLDQLEVRRQIWVADYAGDAEETEANLVSALTELPQTCLTRTESRIMLYQELVGNKILALFLGLYLGITFLLAAAAVLALQQLSRGRTTPGATPSCAAWALRRAWCPAAPWSRWLSPSCCRWPWPHSQRGGYEGGQRTSLPRRAKWMLSRAPPSPPHAAGGVRRLLPGHRLACRRLALQGTGARR